MYKLTYLRIRSVLYKNFELGRAPFLTKAISGIVEKLRDSFSIFTVQRIGLAAKKPAYYGQPPFFIAHNSHKIMVGWIWPKSDSIWASG